MTNCFTTCAQQVEPAESDERQAKQTAVFSDAESGAFELLPVGYLAFMTQQMID